MIAARAADIRPLRRRAVLGVVRVAKPPMPWSIATARVAGALYNGRELGRKSMCCATAFHPDGPLRRAGMAWRLVHVPGVTSSIADVAPRRAPALERRASVARGKRAAAPGWRPRGGARVAAQALCTSTPIFGVAGVRACAQSAQTPAQRWRLYVGAPSMVGLASPHSAAPEAGEFRT